MIQQKMIVEGKDYYLIGELCKTHFPLPKGVSERDSKNFIEGDKSNNEVIDSLAALLKTSGIENIGVVIDADDKGPAARWQQIKHVLNQKGYKNLQNYSLSLEGIVVEQLGLPKIGIWVMPNNLDNGYIEHFAEMMIQIEDALLVQA